MPDIQSVMSRREVRDTAASLKWTVLEIASMLGAQAQGVDDTMVTSVTVDSRHVRDGALFACLRGARTDGHRFVKEAVRSGAAAVLTDDEGMVYISNVESEILADAAFVVVPDVREALLDLARERRRLLPGTFVGITGSCGKTTTKELALRAFEGFSKVEATPGNYNTDIGVSLAILGFSHADTTFVEMGMRALGEIRELCTVARPTIGLITNIGSAHIGELGSIERIAMAKSELAEALPETGTLILNADDQWCDWISERTEARVITAGLASGATIRGSDVHLDSDGYARFDVHIGTPSGFERPPRNSPGGHSWDSSRRRSDGSLRDRYGRPDADATRRAWRCDIHQ